MLRYALDTFYNGTKLIIDKLCSKWSIEYIITNLYKYDNFYIRESDIKFIEKSNSKTLELFLDRKLRNKNIKELFTKDSLNTDEYYQIKFLEYISQQLAIRQVKKIESHNENLKIRYLVEMNSRLCRLLTKYKFLIKIDKNLPDLDIIRYLDKAIRINGDVDCLKILYEYCKPFYTLYIIDNINTNGKLFNNDKYKLLTE